MKIVLCIYVSILLAALMFACQQSTDNNAEGKKLAAIHCGSCHALPEPGTLDKNSWREKVLPVMARKLGLDYMYEQPLKDSQPRLTTDEFKKIASWYYANAPDTMPGQNREKISAVTFQFISKKIPVSLNQYPASSYVKIDPGNHWIYAANAFDSTLLLYNNDLKILTTLEVGGTLVDINFENELGKPGERQGAVTMIGIMNPNDLSTGSIQSIIIAANKTTNSIVPLFNNLPRPVQTITIDMNNDGLKNYIVCGFGNTIGGLYVYVKTDSTFIKKVLKNGPGALKAYVDDFDNNGFPDLIVLMAQAREGIFLFLNNGNGAFIEKEILSFPSIYGSSYFELADFNGDGYKDILYTCGDNADYTANVLKNYHGVYIYLNDGSNRFIEQYFFPLYGCYKAMARDFDNDGDLDLAAISYFPDMKERPQESFVYLEQTAAFTFTPYTIKEFNEGRWLTMDAGDVDGDGDDDIVLCSLVPPYSEQQERWKRNATQQSSLLLLQNQKRH